MMSCVVDTSYGEPDLSHQTLENKSKNLFDGNEFQDPTLNGHGDRFGEETCEDILTYEQFLPYLLSHPPRYIETVP